MSENVERITSWLKTFAQTRVNFRLQNDRRCIQPHVILELGRQGIFAIQIEKQYGGLGLSHYESCKVIEQLGGIDLTIASMVGQNNMGIRPIVNFGSQQLRDEFLPVLATGQMLTSFAMTEPQAGSHIQGITSTIKKTAENKYLLNAQKMWIGMGSWCGVTCVIAKHSGEQQIPNSMTACIVRNGTPGFSVGEEQLSIGMRGSVQNHMLFRDVVVPDSDIVGKVEEGYIIANDIMQFTRLGVAAMSLGAMKRCLVYTIRYASRRKINTGLLIDNTATKMKINACRAKISAVESLVYTTCELLQQSIIIPEIHMVAKITGTEFLGDVVDDALQLLGGRGYSENNLLAYFFVDARALRIFEGPSETLLYYCGQLMKLRSRRTKVFAHLKATDLKSYLEELDSVLQSSSLGSDENFACSARGKMTCWLVLLATLRLSNITRVLPEYSLTEAWILNRIETQMQQLRLEAYNNLLREVDTQEILNSFANVDIEQVIPDEECDMDRLLRRKI
ncbi:acyl-CoA dehydrogenase family protein [Candidatus Uabimicrobium amorphum]|uniref:Non-ribosomal peptide synthase n=1 Tax=Uabimicrobium amorphum TaxID=2596890 RepID=A0A5S9ITL7_UABAM|nr:acyl-CoA dehydrogenase family protein [Candidatus Uabimicrobium amorphum]BBM86395.1 non-ribosomal peptide synthase [Candidatus Uabimicrobium amorphum]